MKNKMIKVLYNVQCAFYEDHIFEKTVEVVDGSKNQESEVEVICPYCQKRVTLIIKGEAALTESVYRNLQ